MTLPPITIVIPCYNDGEFLSEAVTSALATDYPDKELIIVNDGSTDPRTIGVLNDLANGGHGLQVISLPANSGLASARNAGIRAARGEFILPLDSDDLLKPSFLRKAAEVLTRDPAVGVVYGSVRFFGVQDCVWDPPEVTPESMLDFNHVVATAVFRRKVWEDAGGYEETLFRESWEDWDFWLSALERGWRFHRLPEVVFEYRRRADSLSAITLQPETRKKLYSHIYRRHADFYRKHWEALMLMKAERDWALKEQKAHIDKLHDELGRALRLQREIRWFLNWRARVKKWLGLAKD